MHDKTFLEKKETSPGWFVVPSIIILFAIVAYPLGYSLYTSFLDFNIAKPYMGRFFVGVNNYVRALKDPYVIESLRLTFSLSLLVVTVEFVVGLGLALLFNRPSKVAHIIQTLFLIPFAITPIATALLWRYILEPDIGIANYFLGQIGFSRLQWHTGRSTALLSIAFVSSWRWIPFSVIVLLAGLQSIPRAPKEAARIDGANLLQIFRYVTLPMLKPLILFLILIRVLYSLKLFDPIHIMTQGGPGFSTEIFNYHLYKIVFRHFDIAYGAAMSFLMFGISILLCVFVIKFLPEEER